MKTCKCCGIVRDDGDYYPNRLVCKDCDRLKNKKYRLEHREELNAYLRKYSHDNLDKRRVYIAAHRDKFREYDRDRQRAIRDESLAHYGGRCACCGEARREFLAIDHVEGGGNKHRRENNLKSGVAFTRWLKKNGFPEGFRVLCHNCNSAMGYYGYCPHEKEKTEAA